ncbi:MAG TPA: hypothetical protein PKX87_06070 [Alphaproteobacteria bacterium]|nr:hypothetical protein [Alphaproteobacteria bacterium]
MKIMTLRARAVTKPKKDMANKRGRVGKTEAIIAAHPVKFKRLTVQTKTAPKRAIPCTETLARMNINPFAELARLARIAEDLGDLPTASANWRHLSEYCDAKRKSVDPASAALQERAVLTLEQIASLRQDVLSRGLPVIDVEPLAITCSDDEGLGDKDT